MSAQPTFDEIRNDYCRSLQKDAESRKKFVKFVDYLDEEETPNPTANDLKALRYVFISERTKKNIDRLNEACSMIGRDHWDDSFAMTNTSSSYQFHQIFRVELKLCSDLFKKRRIHLCIDSLIALIFIFNSFINAFFDTEDADIAQQILDDFAILWKECMKNRDNETRISTNGYIHEFAKENSLSIPICIMDRIIKWNHYLVPLDSNSRKVLYQLLDELKQNLSGVDYQFDFGEYKDDVMDDNHIWNIQNSEKNEESLKYDELKTKTLSELKEICKTRSFTHFSVKDTKNTLIWRLLRPLQYISELKRTYHYDIYCKQDFFFKTDESEEEIEDNLCWIQQFAEDKYIWENGEIKANYKWDFEMKGIESDWKYFSLIFK